MEDYIPQDEYFEWEDIMQSRSYDSTTFVEHASYLSLSSQCQTDLPRKQPSAEIKGFQWSRGDSKERETEEIAETMVKVSQSAISWEEIGQGENTTNTMEIPTFEEMEYGSEERHASRSPIRPMFERSRDDIDMMEQPWRNVDFLSHRWQEKDIWTTRRYLRLSMQEHEHFSRWENACWRSSAVSRLRLPPVCPLSFNWMRDQDDTWLYGPFGGIAQKTENARLDEQPVKSILKDPSVSELILRGSITTSSRQKQSSMRHLKKRTNVKFSEEVKQYCIIEPTSSEWANDDEECVWIASRMKLRSRNTVRNLPSTTLNSEPSRKISQTPRIPLLRQDASLRPTTTLSEWMWLSGDDEDGEDIDWIAAAADRTSAALKAASEPPPVFEGLAIKEANSKFLNFSGIQFSQSTTSSKEEDDVETEYLLGCNHLEIESMTPDQSDYQSSSSSDDQDEEADSYFERSSMLDKNMVSNVSVMGEGNTYEEIMEEFNLILG